MSFWTRQVSLVGSDVSTTYTNNKKCKLYLFDQNSKRVLVFKPFVDSLSYTFDYKLKDNETKDAYTSGNRETVDGILCKISLGLNLVAYSLEEAKENLHKVNELTRMVKTIVDWNIISNAPKESDKYTLNTYGVYLSNLISNGKHDGNLSDNNHIGFYKKALFCYIDDFKFDVSSKELGFFDVNKKMYPKNINLSFDMSVSFAANHYLSGYHVLLPFENPGGYHPNDVQTWPFSVNGGSPNNFQYSVNKNSYASFYNSSCPNETVKFDLFLENLSLNSKKIGSEKINFGAEYYSKKQYTKNEYSFDFSFDVPSDNIEKAIGNLSLIQRLIRIINNFNAKVKTKTFVSRNDLIELDPNVSYTLNKIMVSNLINTGQNSTTDPNKVNTDGVPCIVKSMSFTPNLDLGMFEEKGFLLFKSFKLDFKCEASNREDECFFTPRYQKGNANPKTRAYVLYDNVKIEKDFIFSDKEYQIVGRDVSKTSNNSCSSQTNTQQTQTNTQQTQTDTDPEIIEEKTILPSSDSIVEDQEQNVSQPEPTENIEDVDEVEPEEEEVEDAIPFFLNAQLESQQEIEEQESEKPREKTIEELENTPDDLLTDDEIIRKYDLQ